MSSKDPDDAVELSDRRHAEPGEAAIAEAVRQAVSPPPASTHRAHHLVDAAAARAQRRRRRRLTGSSVLVAASAAVVATGITATTAPPPPSVSSFAAATTADPAEDQATLLTPSELRAAFPEADSAALRNWSGWSTIVDNEVPDACGASPLLDDLAPPYTVKVSLWAPADPEPPPDLGATVHVFPEAEQAREYAEALQDSVSTCTPEEEDQPPSTPVPGLLGTGASALYSAGYSEERYRIVAVGVRDRFASTVYAYAPAPHTDEGYVTAARAAAGLATTAAARAAEAGLP